MRSEREVEVEGEPQKRERNMYKKTIQHSTSAVMFTLTYIPIPYTQS